MTWAAVEHIAERLSNRDFAILDDVARVRVLTGTQLQRLHFAHLHGKHRDRTRREVLARLTSMSLLTTLERRVGGARAGSAGLVFALDAGGQRLHRFLSGEITAPRRPRQPGTPTDRYLRHCLAVSELYVQLVELARTAPSTLDTFRAEPACWWQAANGQWIKPDAYLVLSTTSVEDVWAVEVDRSTESLATVRGKLLGYLALVERGERGPDDVAPRVLVTVLDNHRRNAVRDLVSGLPPPADELVTVVIAQDAANHLVRVLRE